MLGSPHIRPAQQGERRLLEEIQRRASLVWEEYREALLANPDAIELPASQIKDGRVFVAEHLGNPVAFCVVLPRNDNDAELDGLFVDPPHWNNGIGRTLVDQACRLAGAEGSQALWVIANPRAIGFYEACGFVHRGETQTRFGPGLIMCKAI